MKKVVLVPKDGSQRDSSSTRTRRVIYLECNKNHAANTGGHVVDGCREFMASGQGPNEALTCAACGCHRNFHRIVEIEFSDEVASSMGSS
ncbi:hypothetical protein LIER_28139 [Lithospermum erythrorhizon]|uniref:ZF-HD dimerization-type domain-containing protein n=1 Tax=Lithospermum erythrorhizon TaxID=34254 RepID=A0AAV3RI54_LITER